MSAPAPYPWSYLDGSVWAPYDPAVCAQLDAAVAGTGPRVFTITAPHSGQKYELNVDQMIQTNRYSLQCRIALKGEKCGCGAGKPATSGGCGVRLQAPQVCSSLLPRLIQFT